MSYKIAVASSDGVSIDLSFGAAFSFHIYQVDGNNYEFLEKREYILPEDAQVGLSADEGTCGEGTQCEKGQASSCGNGGGCGNGKGTFPKVELLRDCRCIVCSKIGFQVQKQLERLAIASFDVDCTVEEALTKISAYLNKLDHHQSLRGFSDNTNR